MKDILRMAALAVALISLAACGTTTVLHATFDTEPVGGPPAATQPIGTVTTANGAGSVTVAGSPVPGEQSHWARIRHPNQPAPETVLRAQFDAPHGPGKYGLLCVLFIPSGTGVATVQFENFGGSIGSAADFMHLDFMPENNVRINDDPNPSHRFGTFTRDKSFVLSVQIDSTVNPPKATVTLLGAGASGSADVPNLPAIANQFGAVRVWMGFQFTGTFFVDDILVTRRNS